MNFDSSRFTSLPVIEGITLHYLAAPTEVTVRDAKTKACLGVLRKTSTGSWVIIGKAVCGDLKTLAAYLHENRQ